MEFLRRSRNVCGDEQRIPGEGKRALVALVKSWGPFKPDPISLNEIAALRKKASELIDKVDFYDGPSS